MIYIYRVYYDIKSIDDMLYIRWYIYIYSIYTRFISKARPGRRDVADRGDQPRVGPGAGLGRLGPREIH